MIVALLLLLALTAGCGKAVDLVRSAPAQADLGSLVDSEAARTLLAELMARRSVGSELTATASGVLPADLVQGPDAGRLPDQAQLRALGREISVDFAALTFARALGADPRSGAVQASFDRFVREGAARSSEALQQPQGFLYTVLFAPSFLYVSHPETGADFAHDGAFSTAWASLTAWSTPGRATPWRTTPKRSPPPCVRRDVTASR
jgi:hypothetical protein